MYITEKPDAGRQVNIAYNEYLLLEADLENTENIIGTP